MRPWKLRIAARVVLLHDDHVLLISDSDPGVAGSSWWVLPGGGVDPGEPLAVAATREVAEETGLLLSPADLSGPVATRRVVHGYSDRIRIQDESFFVATVTRFQPTSAGWTTDEHSRMNGFGWFSITDLPHSLWPAALPQLLQTDLHPLDLGQIEESTVPLTTEEWVRINDGVPSR